MRGRNHTLSYRRLGATSAIALTLTAFVVCLGAFLGAIAVAQTGCTPGQILHPNCVPAHLDGQNCIEIDDQTISGTAHNANLFPGPGPYLNTCTGGNFVDWVKDSLANSDPPSLVNAIATGLDPTGASNPLHIPTARVGGTGHWNGIRIVDGVGGLEQDQFLTGGKEDDPDGGPYPGGPFSASAAWNIGPGTIGSPKYDFTQGYLANNDTSLYFGMERLDNNGTTEFEFEFNALPPHCNINGSAVPSRSVNDILFTYLMQGSGTSGSLTPVVMKWDGGAYVAFTPAEQLSFNIKTAINNKPIPCEPWGTPSKSSKTATLWDSLPLDNFRFGEAVAPLCVLLCHGSCASCGSSGVCGSSFYVQVRTRSSTSPTSDLKDTTQVFCVNFGGPSAKSTTCVDCNQHFRYDGSASKDTNGGTNLQYNWKFCAPQGVTLSASGLTGPDANNCYTLTNGGATGLLNVGGTIPPTGADITATLSVSQLPPLSPCATTANDSTSTVFASVAASCTAATSCDTPNTAAFTSSASGGKPPYSFAWVITNGSQIITSALQNPTVSGLAAGQWTGTVTVTDSQTTLCDNAPSCTATCSKTINVFNPFTNSCTVSTSCDGHNSISATVSASGGKSPYHHKWYLDDAYDPTKDDQTGPTFTGVSAGSHTVKVISNDTADTAGAGVTPKGVCTSTCTKTINVFDVLAATCTLSTSCAGHNTISATVTPTGGKAPYHTVWSVDGAVDATKNDQMAPTFTGVAAGSHTVKVTVTDTADTGGAGVTPKGVCSTDCQHTINVFDQLTTTCTLATSCDTPNSVAATASPVGGKGPYSYEWRMDGGSTVISTDQNPTFNGLSAGSHSFTVTVKDTADSSGDPAVTPKEQCSTTCTHSINVFNPLTASCSLSGTCETLQLSYTAQGSGGKGPYTYAWTFYDSQNNVVGTSNTQTGTLPVANDDTYHASVLVKDTADSSSDPAVTAKGQCSYTCNTNPITVVGPLAPTIKKDGIDLTTAPQSAIIDGTFHAADSVVLSVAPSDRKNNLKGPFVTTGIDVLTASTFYRKYNNWYAQGYKEDATVTLDGITYIGYSYTVQFKVTVSRTLNGAPCTETAGPILVSYIEATDPVTKKHIKQVR